LDQAGKRGGPLRAVKRVQEGERSIGSHFEDRASIGGAARRCHAINAAVGRLEQRALRAAAVCAIEGVQNDDITGWCHLEDGAGPESATVARRAIEVSVGRLNQVKENPTPGPEGNSSLFPGGGFRAGHVSVES